MARNVLGPNPRHPTFSTLVTLIERDYEVNERRSAQTMRGSLVHLRRHLGGHLPADVTHALLTDYVDKRRAEKARTFPIGALPELLSLLEAPRDVVLDIKRRLGAVIVWVFPRFDGSRLGSFRKARDTACKAAGIPGRVPHDLRRSAVRNQERASVPRSVVMKVTGHRPESVCRRYAIVSESDLAEAIAKLAKWG